MKVHYSSNDHEWYTPRTFFNRLNTQWNFTLDPCATKESALCKKFYTKEDDGLKQSWAKERVFMNPPYGRDIGKWVQKAFAETTTAFSKDSAQLVMGLLPARTDTNWFHKWVLGHAQITFLKGRIKFLTCNEFGELTEGDSCPFPNILALWI